MPDRLSAAVRELSSDRFAGRATGAVGEPIILSYLIDGFRHAGLRPGGDLHDGQRAWTQAVSLVRSDFVGPVQLGVGVPGRPSLSLKQGEEVAIRPPAAGVDKVAIDAAPLLFVGYGVEAPERRWDDYKGVDVRGKIVLILLNDPDFETGKGDFGGRAMTYYGRWTYKLEEAERKGALGALVIHEEKAASYGWSTVRNSNAIELFDLEKTASAPPTMPLAGWIQHDLATDLLRAAGLDLEELRRRAQGRDFHPVMLPGVTLSARFSVGHANVLSHNVVAMLPGRTRPEDLLIYAAHWDHLGQRSLADGTTVTYGGAVDNASGIASLLALASCFGHAPRPPRSLAFMATTAEEKGMLGAEYYVRHPLYPLGHIVGVLNMDMMNVSGATRDVSTFGHVDNGLRGSLAAGAARQGRSFTEDAAPEAGHFYRSDNLPFARAGVPSLTFSPGEDSIAGGPGAGHAQRLDYYAHRYHQPADRWTDKIVFSGMAQDIALLFDVGYGLAASDAWPRWDAGSEFGGVLSRVAGDR